MSTQKHTQGPWKYHLERGTNPRWHVQTSAGYQIASTPELGLHGPENAEREANARLIAAAPELLAELTNCIEQLGLNLDHFIDLDRKEPRIEHKGTCEILRETIRTARAAIAKAEGRA